MSNHANPTKWSVGHISDIALVNPSISVSDLDDDDPVSFLTMADVGENGRILNHQVRRLCDVRAGFTRFQEGDILFAKITPCMENGKGAYARNLVNGHGFGSTEFHVLRATDRGDAEFLYHISQSVEVRQKAIAFFTGSAGQQRVDASFFYRFPLLIPTSPEQRRIARILTTLDNLIEKTEALIAKYQAIKQGMMRDLFTRGVDEHGHLRPSYAEAADLYKPSELGRIPKEWGVKSLVDVTPGGPKNGYFKKPELVGRGYKLVNVTDLYQPYGIDTDYPAVERIEASDADVQKYGVADGDLFITRSSLVLTGIAHCNIVQRVKEPTLFECHVMRLRPNKQTIKPDFLALYLESVPKGGIFV
jgi:type I restriction enzyme, S subunit